MKYGRDHSTRPRKEPTMTAAFAAGLTLFGALVGALGTYVGAGGGFLFVPFLLLLCHLSPATAAGTSLAAVLANSLSGTYSYVRQKKVHWPSAWRFSLATIPGAVTGALATRYLSQRVFDLLFGILLLSVSSILFFERSEAAREDQGSGQGEAPKYPYTLGIILSLGVGFASSLLGIGGGILHVPIMILLLKFPAHVATGTSHCILAFSALVGTLGHARVGNISYPTALFLCIGAVVGAQGGAHLAGLSKPVWIKKVLAFCLCGVGIRLLVSGFL